MYRHTQVGRLVIGANGALALLMLILVALGAPRALLAVVAGLVVLAALFGTLTVEVDSVSLRFRFGSGGWGKAVPRSEIVGVTPARSRWTEGIGIRFTRQGMLYNVAAGPAVQVELRSGQRFRLGTDEPERLAQVLGRQS